MRAVVVARQGTPVHANVEVVDDWPDPVAGRGEVLVRTEASAMNHLDLWVGRGLPGMKLDYPRITGSDACGVVEAVGDDVDTDWLGKRVILNGALPKPEVIRPGAQPTAPGIAMIGEHLQGTMAQRFAAPVGQIQAVPDDGDPVAAAAFGLSFLTAWRCLVTRAELRAGQIVLVTGIGGGVALSGLKIALHFGCRVIVTSRHHWKLDRACELGASDGVVDSGQDWSSRVRQLTGKRGVDVVLDSTGKATHLWCIKSLARGGVYATPGCTTGADATTDLARIFWNQLRIVGSTMGDASEFAQVTALFRSGALTPVVDSVHAVASAADAYRRIESGDQFGKVVIRW